MVSDAIEILGWTLLHFVWQGAVVGVLAAMLLAVLRRRSASARYLTSVAALGLMLVLPLFTIAWIERTPPSGDISPIVMMKSTIEIPRTRDDGSAAMDEPPIKVERIDFENAPPSDAAPGIPVTESRQSRLDDLSEKRSAFNAQSFLKPYIPWGVAAWLIGVGVLSLRLFASWWSVRCLRRRATQPAGETWQAMLRRLAERLRVTRPLKLVESALVEVPAVIGWLRPVILIPAAAMTGLTTEQLEALLAHELAHVRRHDYLINLLQTAVETLLFYHPAVWWVSHRIRVEREHCCDDLAVQVCGDGLTYAKALVALEELRAPKLGLAMSSSGGSLLTRVARLLGQAEQQRRPTGWVAGLLSMVLLTMAGALGAGLLTPPEKPTEGLPNDTQPAATKLTDTNEKTSGPTEQRGQETRAERELFVTVAEGQTLDLEFEQSVKTVEGFDSKILTVTTPSPTTARVKSATVGLTIVTVTDIDGTEFAVPIEVLPKSKSDLSKSDQTTFHPKPRKNPLLRPVPIGQDKVSVVFGVQQPRFLEFPKRILHVDGFDPLVIKVDAVSPQQLRVTGLAIGKTSFTAATEGDKQHTVEFEVTPLKLSRESIRKLFAAKDGDLPGGLRSSDAAGTGDPRQAQANEVIPIHGQCIAAKEDRPIEDAEVRLYRLERAPRKNLLMIAAKTDALGRFDLGTFPELGEGQNYFVGVRAQGFASSFTATREKLTSLERSAPLTIRLAPAATLSGTVVGPDDQPLAGVKVNLAMDWIPGIRSTTTDAQGRFALEDAAERVEGTGRTRLILEHSELGRKDVWYSRCPDTLDVKFVAPAIVEGMILNADGSPARNETVHCQSTHTDRANVLGPAEHSATTDDQGRYRIAFQVAGKVNLLHMARNPDFVAEAIESIEVVNGQSVTAPPMQLVKGGLIVGQVIDSNTGKPVVVRPFESFHVGAHGPSRPNSSPIVVVAHVKPDGTYSLRVPPGRSYPYLSQSRNSQAEGSTWSVTQGANSSNALSHPVDLLEGDTITLNFKVSLGGRRNAPAAPELQPVDPPASTPSTAARKGSPKKPAARSATSGRLVGQVRLKTEKPLPDLEKVEVPVGKVLDESLVFSKEGGLANVFVYLRKPTFKIEEPEDAGEPKPFVLIAEDGKFWPHAAFVRVGRPVLLENRQAENVNFLLQPLRNNAYNVLVASQKRFKLPAFTVSESFPPPVKSNIHPWLQAYLFPLDHPFADVTDEDGRFAIDNLPLGEHEFRVWHERVGYLEKSLVITIKPDEETRRELEYQPDQLKLTEAEVLAWGNRQIDSVRIPIPQRRVPQPAAPKEANAEAKSEADPKPAIPPKLADSKAEIERARRDILRHKAENNINVRYAKKLAEVTKAEWEKSQEANRKVPGSISEAEVGRMKSAYEVSLLRIAQAEAEQALARAQFEDESLDEPSAKLLEVRLRAAKAAVEVTKAAAALAKQDWERWQKSRFNNSTIEHSRLKLAYELAVLQGEVADSELSAVQMLQAGKKVDDRSPDSLALHWRLAKAEADLAQVEYEKLVDANRKVPGSVQDTEVERARLKSVKSQLESQRKKMDVEQARLPQETDKPEDSPKTKDAEPRSDATKPAIERGVAFLKSQQTENGLWPEFAPTIYQGGASSLCVLALLQSGVKPDEAVIQKALAPLRTITPDKIYTVALQTMVFCVASPKEDAELIRRNVAWIEKAQVADGKMRGSWSYGLNHGGRGDGSCARFAVLGLHAAKKAGFEVQAETWRRLSDYWLTTQKDQGGWGYTPEASTTPTMTLAGVASLATANRYLPNDDQTTARVAAMLKPADYLEKMIPELSKATFALYALHSLERAGHVGGIAQFGQLDWKTDAIKRLLETQHANGYWKGSNTAENELIATSFSLLVLTGQPEPKQNARVEHGAPDPASRPTAGLTDADADSEARQTIERWREATNRLVSFESEIDRWEHDYVFNVMKRGEGTFRWQGVDSWRIELRASKVKSDSVTNVKHWQTGELTPLRVQASVPEIWSRHGDLGTFEDGTLAENAPLRRRSFQIPKELPPVKGFWETIAMSPMLVVFHLSRNQCFLPPAKESPHKIQITRRESNELWLDLQPVGDEAANYQHLMVILDQQTSLPRSVRLIDPVGTKETVITYRSPRIEWKKGREKK